MVLPLRLKEVAPVALRINTNVASLAAQRNLSQSQRNLDTTMKQLATGSRFADPTAGAGDFAIAEHLRGQIQGQRAARNNADNAVSFMQVAEGGLNEQNNILIRLRELAVQAASDTFSDVERGMMDLEFQQLSQELDRIAQTTRFGSTSLLSGSSSNFEFQVGTHSGSENIIAFKSDANTTASKLGISGAGVSDKDDALDSLDSIDEALTSVAEVRAKFGAAQARFESAVNNADVAVENLEAAHSRIADTDFAQAASEMFKEQALTQYQISILSQANQYPQSVLRLLA